MTHCLIHRSAVTATTHASVSLLFLVAAAVFFTSVITDAVSIVSMTIGRCIDVAKFSIAPFRGSCSGLSGDLVFLVFEFPTLAEPLPKVSPSSKIT